MKYATILLSAVLLAACASTGDKKVENETDAVKDFINLNNIDKMSSVRNFDNPNTLIINRRYIIAYFPDRQYLLEYVHDCRLAELDSAARLPDQRRRTRVLSVRTDTFRGCPVKGIYEITLKQAEELMEIGRAPAED